MPKIKKETLKKEKYEFPEYSNEELREFEKEMESYKITKTLDCGDEVIFYDEDKYLKDNGALNENGDVMVTGWHEEENMKNDYYYPVCDYPPKLELITNKLEQLYKLQGRTEYAKKMELDGLKELSEKMKIQNLPSVEYYNND